MSNFKSGSGNLDFGGSDDNEGSEPTGESTQTDTESDDRNESSADEQSSTDQSGTASSDPDTTTDSPQGDDAPDESATASSSPQRYPYFIRRSNVGDERETRLEIHVRDKVADREAAFRNELAEQLDTNEISKTDAREFALLAAFQHPERVAELMAEEGFGTL